MPASVCEARHTGAVASGPVGGRRGPAENGTLRKHVHQAGRAAVGEGEFVELQFVDG